MMLIDHDDNDDEEQHEEEEEEERRNINCHHPGVCRVRALQCILCSY